MSGLSGDTRVRITVETRLSKVSAIAALSTPGSLADLTFLNVPYELADAVTSKLRELGIDELTRRLEEFTGRTGLRGAVEISQAEERPGGGRIP